MTNGCHGCISGCHGNRGKNSRFFNFKILPVLYLESIVDISSFPKLFLFWLYLSWKSSYSPAKWPIMSVYENARNSRFPHPQNMRKVWDPKNIVLIASDLHQVEFFHSNRCSGWEKIMFEYSNIQFTIPYGPRKGVWRFSIWGNCPRVEWF